MVSDDGSGLDYVNGALFSGHLAFAEINSAMRAALLACTEFDWSLISPAVSRYVQGGIGGQKEGVPP
jgi:hypothetical protein